MGMIGVKSQKSSSWRLLVRKDWIMTPIIPITPPYPFKEIFGLKKCLVIILEKKMPIANKNYEKWYNKNREVLIAKMKEKYDAEMKKEYYDRNREQILKGQADRYKNKKAERNKTLLHALLLIENNPNKSIINDYLTTKQYQNLSLIYIKYLQNLCKNDEIKNVLV